MKQERYSSYRHISTIASTTSVNAGLGRYVPYISFALQARLSHATSSTAAELTTIQEALHIIIQETPTPWTAFTNSKSALQGLSGSIIKKKLKMQILQHIGHLHHEAACPGRTVFFQWIPKHCGIAGNECVDVAAKNWTLEESTTTIPYSREQMPDDRQIISETLLNLLSGLMQDITTSGFMTSTPNSSFVGVGQYCNSILEIRVSSYFLHCDKIFYLYFVFLCRNIFSGVLLVSCYYLGQCILLEF